MHSYLFKSPDLSIIFVFIDLCNLFDFSFIILKLFLYLL